MTAALVCLALVTAGLTVTALPASAAVTGVTVCPDGTSPCTSSTSGPAGAINQTWVIRFHTDEELDGDLSGDSITLYSGTGTQFPSGGGIYTVHDEGGPNCYPNDFSYGFPVTGGSTVTLETTYACISSNSWVDVTITGMTNPLTPGNGYYAQVSSSKATTPLSSSTYTIVPGTAPAAPTGTAATANYPNATVSWTAPTDTGTSPITDYLINAYANGTGTPTTTDTQSTNTSADVPGLTPGVPYTFTVQAVNAAGPGTASTASTPLTLATAPALPTGVHARTVSRSMVHVKWTDGSNGGSKLTARYINVYVYHPATRTTPAVYTLSKSVPISVTAQQWTVGGLSKFKRYAFTVVVLNAVGGSASNYSNVVAG